MRFLKLDKNNKIINAIEATQEFIDSLDDGFRYVRLDNEPESVVMDKTFEELQIIKCKELNYNSDMMKMDLQEKYSSIEKESFEEKREEAKGYIQSDGCAPTLYIDTLLKDPFDLQEKESFINSIWENIKTLGKIERITKEKREQIKACKTIEDLESIDITIEV